MPEKPALIILVGLVGSGKSTVARRLAEEAGMTLICSDIVRKRLAGLPPSVHRYEGPEQGIYSPEFSRQTYDAMLREAEENLTAGKSVIIDASFRRMEDRHRARELGERAGVPFWLMECRAPEEVARERLRKRREQTFSDATIDIFDDVRRNFDPVTEQVGNHLILDTTRPLDENVDRVLASISRGTSTSPKSRPAQ